MHDLTAGTEFAAGSEVACHPSLAQPNFVFRNMVPVAIIDWDGTKPGSRRDNLGDFLWAFVYPALYGDGEPAAAMLDAALDGYAWTGPRIVEAMLTAVRVRSTATTRAPGPGRARLHGAERRLLRPAPQRLTRAAGRTGFSNGRATSQALSYSLH